MDMMKRQPIGVELVKRNIVQTQDIEKALDYQKMHPEKKLGDIIHEMNMVADPQLLIEAIGDVVGIKGKIVYNRDLNPQLLNYIGTETAKRYKINFIK